MSRDFRDLLSELSGQGVEYLVVGAHALAAWGHVRATKNLDLWINPTADNAERTLRSVVNFGAPLGDLQSADLQRPGVVFQIGVEPLRIDLLTSVDGLEFDEAWRARVRRTVAGVPVDVLSREHLIRNKKASGRLQDLADVEALENLSG